MKARKKAMFLRFRLTSSFTAGKRGKEKEGRRGFISRHVKMDGNKGNLVASAKRWLLTIGGVVDLYEGGLHLGDDARKVLEVDVRCRGQAHLRPPARDLEMLLRNQDVSS